VAGPTLKSKGPSTVFAPTNEAFDKLPEGTVAMLVKPENKQKLTGILTYHVVGGKLTAKKLSKEIEAGGGQVKLKTVNGETLIAKAFGDSAFTNQVRSGANRCSSILPICPLHMLPQARSMLHDTAWMMAAASW
jgi:uncharacterized surface protein with fasciclin (FAS1) repeats